MSKTITSNSRTDNAFSLVHLFTFEMDKDWDGTVGEAGEILYFTDHDVFVTYDGNEYTPLAITFDKLSEDFSMGADTISLSIDNINSALTTEALASEWRNNPCKITRVIYTPPAETIGSDVYEFGVRDTGSAAYPNMNLDTDGITYDVYTLFEGIIDTFNATSQVLNATITTEFVNWSKAYPARTYNQNEFTSVVNAIATEIYWGRQNVT